MPRPQKGRKVCMLPNYSHFSPQDKQKDNFVNMTVDEYETIRLIDLEDFTQEQCALQMQVARTTVQAIYACARKKLALCIVEGSALVIEGGQYRLCEHREGYCGQGCRRKRGASAHRQEENYKSEEKENE